jgi:hypothetical protein
MQILPGIIKIENGKGKWCDITGTPGEVPRITLALAAQLVIDLRSNRLAAPQTADLAPYPFAEVGNCSAFYIAVDSDYNQLTIPPIIRTSGITASQDADGSTILAAALPLLDSPELRNAVKTSTEVLLKAELGGLDATGQTVFVVQFPLVLQNRVYIPDGSGGETPDPADPDYLTTPQIKAYINDELAAAIAALKLPVGETGPAPIITIGTVEEGEDAAAAIVPVGEGAYAINLTLPRATDGETPEPITPQIAIGTIQSGDAAAATLTPVIGTPGAFTLNLTLPRGADGAGVTPRGPWAAGTTYNQNDAIRHASAWWRSLHDDNVGHEPPANRVDNAHWEVIVKDGLSADPLVVSYNDTDNPDDADWHLDRRATDKYYRWTTDGGLTFTEAALLTQAAIEPILRFNQDATTDWRNLPAAAGTNNYHSVIGKYCRIKTSGGVWGDAKKVHELNASESYRVQFGATPPEGAIDPDTGAPLEPDWHANFLPGDDRIIFYNLSGTIRLDVKVTLPEGEEIGGVQFCAIADPWHADYAEGDRFRKISMDGGATYSQPIPLYGKSTYEEWLAAGNTGAPEEFLDSLKGVEWPAGGSPGKVLMYGPSGPTWGSLAEYTPIPQPVEPPSPEDLGLIDLPDGVEKRIWRHLCVRRPNEGRDLHLFWQTSMNGVQWGTLYSSATHPHCVATRGAGGEPIAFTTEYGPAMLPVEFIPVLDIHVRTCWGYLDGENVWHKGDWTYHNTLGVRLSLEGLPLEKPDYFNPEYFLIPIPDGTDQCEIRLSTDDDFRGKEVLFSNTLYSSEAKGFFFDGQNLLPATQETVESLPVPFNAAAFEGQWFVFKRRGIAKYNIRAVWTGDNPVIYVWSPEKAYEQEA